MTYFDETNVFHTNTFQIYSFLKIFNKKKKTIQI